jgi:hypothetical protein
MKRIRKYPRGTGDSVEDRTGFWDDSWKPAYYAVRHSESCQRIFVMGEIILNDVPEAFLDHGSLPMLGTLAK